MKTRFITALAVCTVCLSACSTKDKLQGTWRITSYRTYVSSPEYTDPPEKPNYYLVITDNTFVIKYEDASGIMTSGTSGDWQLFGNDVIEFHFGYCGRFTITELSNVLSLDDASQGSCTYGFPFSSGVHYIHFEKK